MCYIYIYINFFQLFIYVTCIFMCFSYGVYLYFRILMYVKCHKQFEIGCGAILNIICVCHALSAVSSQISKTVEDLLF